MCPGFDSQTRRHMWTEFVGSVLCSERFFSGYSGFPLSSKTNIWFDWFDLIYLIYSLPNYVVEHLCLARMIWDLNKVIIIIIIIIIIIVIIIIIINKWKSLVVLPVGLLPSLHLLTFFCISRYKTGVWCLGVCFWSSGSWMYRDNWSYSRINQ